MLKVLQTHFWRISLYRVLFILLIINDRQPWKVYELQSFVALYSWTLNTWLVKCKAYKYAKLLCSFSFFYKEGLLEKNYY